MVNIETATSALIESSPKDFYLANAPLGNRLLYPTERSPVSEQLYETSRHELRHALVALSLGVTPTFVSVEREGNTLGMTGFDGSTSLGKFKIIAAAGAVNKNGIGFARGSGMDLYQVAVANFLENLNPENVQPYINWAQTLLDANYSEQVLDRAASILAKLGRVGGSEVSKILAQAEFELKLEKLFYTDNQKQINAIEKMDRLDEFLEKEPEEIRIQAIEEDNNHNLKVSWATGENPEKLSETKVCPFCGPIENNHNLNCKFRLLETTSSENNPTRRGGTIFEAKDWN